SKQTVKVAADTFGGNNARRHCCLRSNHAVVRQQLHLEVVRHLHLVRETLLLDRRAHESRVLDGGADLRGNRGDELLVAGREWESRPAVGQIHYTERRGATRWGRSACDGSGEHRTSPVACFFRGESLAGLGEDRLMRS